MATIHQFFQFNGSLYEQIDDVAMGSPLGPVMVNTFMCSIEKKLEMKKKLPYSDSRYVDDTLAALTATGLIATLNKAHPSINFTMEIAINDKLPFTGMELMKMDSQHASAEKQQTKAFFSITRAMRTTGVNDLFSRPC